ncbi:hypothetical protein BDV11DRAFT_198482 [Aspergillus similis]
MKGRRRQRKTVLVAIAPFFYPGLVHWGINRVWETDRKRPATDTAGEIWDWCISELTEGGNLSLVGGLNGARLRLTGMRRSTTNRLLEILQSDWLQMAKDRSN